MAAAAEVIQDSHEAARLRDRITALAARIQAEPSKWASMNDCMALAAREVELANAYTRLGISRGDAFARAKAYREAAMAGAL
jgi:hypothetical protein